MDRSVRLLHVDDSFTDGELLQIELKRSKFACEVKFVATQEEYCAELERGGYDVILSDFRMGLFDGDQALALAKQKLPDVPFILVTGELGEEFVIDRLKRGVADYVLKDNMKRLIPAIERTLREVEERRKRLTAEETVKEGEDRFRAFVTATSDVVYSMSPDWSEMRNLVGQDFIADTKDPSRTWMDKYIPSDDQPLVKGAIQQAIKTKSIFELEHRVVRVDGSLGWTFSRAIPLLDATGEIVEWFGAARDITERKHAEEQVKKQAKLLDVIQDAVTVTDTKGRIVYWNKAAETIFGYQAAEVLGKFMPDVVHSPITAAERSTMIEQITQEGLMRSELQLKRKDGSSVFIEGVNTALKDDNGNVVGFISANRDISARKSLEEERNEALKRERAERRAAEHAKAKTEQELAQRREAEEAMGKWALSPLHEDELSSIRRYGVSLAFMAGCLLLRYLADPILDDHLPYITVFGGIALAIWYGGIGPAVLSSFTGYLVATWLFISPRYHFDFHPYYFLGLFLFLLSSFAIAFLGDKMQRAQRQARQSARVAVERQKRTEAEMEKRLQAQEEARRSAAVFEATPDFVAIAGMDGQVVYMNPAGRRMVGITDDADLRQFGRAAFTPQWVLERTEKEWMPKALRDGSVAGEGALRTIEGKEIPVSFVLIVHRNEAGEPESVSTVARNISDRVHAESALRASEERLQYALDATSEGVWDWNIKTGEVHFSRRWVESLGYERHEVLPHVSFWENIVHPDDMPRLRRVLQDHFEGRTPVYAFENRLRMKNGEYRWNLDRGKVVEWDDEGNPVRMVGADMDITDRKQAEQVLQQHEEQLRIALEIGRVGTYFHDFTTGEMRWSAATRQLFGIGPDEVVTQEIATGRIHPDDRSRVIAAAQESWSPTSNGRFEAEYRIIHPDGSIRWVGARGNTVFAGENGTRHILYSMGAVVDLTEQKQAEERLRWQRDQLHLLQSAMHSVYAADSLEAVYAATLDGIIKSVGADRASILLFDSDKKVHFKAWRNLSDGYRAAVDGHCPWSIDELNATPILMPDIAKEESLGTVREVILGEGIHACGFFPLRGPQQLLGKFMVYFNTPHNFTTEEIGLLEAIATTLSLAIQRWRNQSERDHQLERYQLSLQAANQRAFEHELSTGILTWSPLTEGITIFDPGHPNPSAEEWNEMVVPEDREKLRNSILYILEKGTECEIEYRVRAADGSIRWVVGHGRSIKGPDGKATHVSGLIQDITERKAVTESLRISEEHFRLATTTKGITLYEQDLDLRYTWVFPRHPEFYEHNIGKSDLELLPRDQGQILTDLKQQVISAGVGARKEITVTLQDGVRHYDLLVEPRRDESGRITGVAGVAMDITERKLADEMRLTLNRQMEMILSSIDDRFVSLDADWRFTYFNEQTKQELRKLGRDPERMIGKRLWEEWGEVPPAETFRRVMAERIALSHEYYYAPLESWLEDKVFPTPDGGVAIFQQNVTERKRAEHILREKEKELETIINRSPFLLTRCSRDLRYRFVSNAYAAMIDRLPEEIIGKSIAEIMGEDGLNTIRPHIERVLQGEVVRYEAPVHFKGIGDRHLSAIYTPDIDLSGNVIGWIASILDITERKRAEEALAKTAQSLARERERLTIALRTGQLGVYEWRVGEDTIWWSPEVYPVFGVDPATFVPTLESFGTIIHPDDREELWRKTEESIARREVFTHEYRVLWPDGSVHWVANRSHVGLDADGNVERITGVAVNITERIGAEAALRESEERFRLATSAGAVGVWDWNIISNTVSWSDSIYDIHGVRRGGFDGTVEAFASLVHPDDRSMVNDAIQQALRGNSEYELEFRAVRPDDATIWIYTKAQVIRNASGAPVRMLGSTVDITRRKKAEEELVQLNQELDRRVLQRTEELVRANKELDAFTYSVSHDLKAPLRALSGFVSLLESEETDRLSANGRHYLEVITRSARHMNQLVEDLLSFSRFSRQEMETRMIDMEEIFTSVAGELQQSEGTRKVKVKIHQLPTVKGDAGLLRQVATNLLANAFKFTREKAEAKIEIGSIPHDSESVYYVKDNGAGFNPEYAGRLFQVFHRLHQQEEFEGTGVGLSIVRRIIERHGGRVWADGKTGEGATFYFSVPAGK